MQRRYGDGGANESSGVKIIPSSFTFFPITGHDFARPRQLSAQLLGIMRASGHARQLFRSLGSFNYPGRLQTKRRVAVVYRYTYVSDFRSIGSPRASALHDFAGGFFASPVAITLRPRLFPFSLAPGPRRTLPEHAYRMAPRIVYPRAPYPLDYKVLDWKLNFHGHREIWASRIAVLRPLDKSSPLMAAYRWLLRTLCARNVHLADDRLECSQKHSLGNLCGLFVCNLDKPFFRYAMAHPEGEPRGPGTPKEGALYEEKKTGFYPSNKFL